MCDVTSDSGRAWWVEINGMALHDMCYQCGYICEAWPQLTAEQVHEKVIANEDGMRDKVARARLLAPAAPPPTQTWPTSTATCADIGIRSSQKAALVHRDVFEGLFDKTLAKLNYKPFKYKKPFDKESQEQLICTRMDTHGTHDTRSQRGCSGPCASPSSLSSPA